MCTSPRWMSEWMIWLWELISSIVQKCIFNNGTNETTTLGTAEGMKSTPLQSHPNAKQSAVHFVVICYMTLPCIENFVVGWLVLVKELQVLSWRCCVVEGKAGLLVGDAIFSYYLMFTPCYSHNATNHPTQTKQLTNYSTLVLWS